MLQPAEIEELRNGTWELDCPRMTLRKSAKNGIDVYEGGGYVKRTPDGDLRFKLYSARQLNFARIFYSKAKLGQLIDDEEYYELSATDVKGRIWKSTCILPNTSGYAGEEGVAVSGKLNDLICTSKKQPPSIHKYSNFNMKFFHAFKIPCNTGTQSSITIGGRIRGQHVSLDTAQFESCDCEFEMRTENGMVTFGATANVNRLPPNLEVRALESLQFVLAIPLEWVVLQKSEGDVETISIKRVSAKLSKTQLGPPIDFRDPRNVQFVWKLYDKYLSYVLRYEEAHKYHPLSVFVHQVMRGSEGSIEAKMLTLGIAVEGVLREAFPDLAKLPEQESKELEKARQVIDKSSLKKECKERIKGAICSWTERSATDRLCSLVESGVIERNEVDAWKDIRHPSAHATLLDLRDLQKFTDLCHTVTVLFYKLIFHAIGYKGKYTNYSTHGWPLKDYPAVGES